MISRRESRRKVRQSIYVSFLELVIVGAVMYESFVKRSYHHDGYSYPLSQSILETAMVH